MVKRAESRWSFDLPRDAIQRRVAATVLARFGAPFDPADGAEFRARVKAVWNDYVSQRNAHPLHAWDRRFHQRKREEFIDDPSLPPARRTRLMRHLDRLNRATGFYYCLMGALEAQVAALPPGRDVKILDVGSG